MLVLGLETSGQPGSVAIVDEHRVLARCSYAPPSLHAEHLLEHVDLALRTAGCSRLDLGKIAVGTGPGNFTGLRVGIALASGIGLGLGIPVVGVCSLASMAAAITAPGELDRFVIRDARRGEVFCAAYSPGVDTIIAPTLVAANQLYDWFAPHCAERERNGQHVAVAGDGLQWLTAAQRAHLGIDATETAQSISPDAQHTARVGFGLHSTDAVVPVYVREADAVMPRLTKNFALDRQ